MKLYVRRQQVFWYVTAIVLLVSLGIYAYLRIGKVIASATHLTRASRVVTNAEQLMVRLTAAQTGVRGYVITADESQLEPFHRAEERMSVHFQVLKEATRGNPVQSERVDQLVQEVDRVMAFADRMVSLRRDEGFEHAKALVMTGEGPAMMEMVRQRTADIQAYEREAFREQNTITAEDLFRFRMALLALLIAAIAIIVYLFYRINRHLESRTKVEAELRRASEEITALNKELEGYTYSVSHDLRAPLRSIAGYAQVLREDYADRLDDEGNRVIDVVIRNAHQMGQLIDDLLHFSRVGRKELFKSTCNMDEMVRSVLEELGVEPESPQLQLRVEPLPAAMADAGMIKQVWANLLSNALKYSSKREVAKIEVGCRREAGFLCYFVKDNGVGFNMTYRDKLFGVFQRLHKASEFPGTGVGLALVKRIITRHGGKIWAEAQLNAGATFYFTLPA